jgi:hypothetical protein
MAVRNPDARPQPHANKAGELGSLGVRAPGKGGGRDGDRPMDLRHRRVLRAVRLGHRDGGTPIERAAGTVIEALSEIRSPGGSH